MLADLIKGHHFSISTSWKRQAPAVSAILLVESQRHAAAPIVGTAFSLGGFKVQPAGSEQDRIPREPARYPIAVRAQTAGACDHRQNFAGSGRQRR
jgi:hypothetical protein